MITSPIAARGQVHGLSAHELARGQDPAQQQSRGMAGSIDGRLVGGELSLPRMRDVGESSPWSRCMDERLYMSGSMAGLEGEWKYVCSTDRMGGLTDGGFLLIEGMLSRGICRVWIEGWIVGTAFLD